MTRKTLTKKRRAITNIEFEAKASTVKVFGYRAPQERRALDKDHPDILVSPGQRINLEKYYARRESRAKKHSHGQ